MLNTLQSTTEEKSSQSDTITGTIELSKLEKIENEPSAISTETNTLSVNNPSGLPISDWQHQGNFFYTTIVPIHTVNAVNILVGYIVNKTDGLGKKATARITSTLAIVTYIVNNFIHKIWYTDKVYYKTVVPNDPNKFKMKVAEKRIHTFYEDAGRTKNMQGSPVTSETWLEGYSGN